MPAHEAELVISCKSSGTNTVNDFNKAVLRADKSSAALKKTVAGIFSSAAFFKVGKESIALFKIQEAATEGLRSALLKQGIAFNIVTDELMKFNGELQSLTIHGDEELAMIQAQGLNMGITADKIKEATKAAIGLSAAYNMQLGSAMMLIARASQGQTQMLSRYGIVLEKNLSPQQKYAELLKIGTSNMQLATDKTKTLSGSTKQMTNVVNDAKEVIGRQFSSAILFANNYIKDLAQGFIDLNPETQRFIVITGTLTAGMTALRTAINLKTIAEQIATGTTLAHSGAMAETGRAAEIQKKHMAELMEYSARLNALDIERAGLVKGVADADKDRLQVYQKLEAADRKAKEAAENVDQATRSFAEAKAAWFQDIDDTFLRKNVKFQIDQLNKYNAELVAAKKNVAKLENVYIDLNESWKQATYNLTAFDDARKKEKDYTNSLKETKAAIAARYKALAEGKSSLEADDEAIQAYNNSLAEQSQKAKVNAEAEMRRAQALKMGATEAEANRVKTQYLNKVMAQSGESTGIITRGLGAMKIGFRSAAVAAKGLMRSMLPMLAISVGLSILDRLINRVANANKAAAEIAEKELESAKQLVAQGNEQRTLDQEKLSRYQELARYSDRTAEEQEELVKIANELNSQYEGMNVPILHQNRLLQDTSGLWEKIKKKQHEAYLQNMRDQLDVQKKDLQTAALRTADEIHETWSWDKYNADKREEMFNEITKRNINNQIPELLQLRKIFADRNDVDRLEAIDSYIQKVKNLIAFQNNIKDAYVSSSTGVGNLNQREVDKKVNEAIRKRDKSIADEEWTIAFRRAGWKEQWQLLEAKRKDREKELSLINARTKDVKEIKRMAELQKELLNIEDEKYKIKKEYAKIILDTKKSIADEKWTIAFSRAGWKEQWQLLEAKRKDREKELSLINARTKDVKEIKRMAELQKELLNIEDEKYKIKKEYAKIILDTVIMTGCGHNVINYGDGIGFDAGINPENMTFSFNLRYGKILSAVTRDNVQIEMTGKATADGIAETAGKSGVVTDGNLKVKIGKQVNGYTVDLAEIENKKK